MKTTTVQKQGITWLKKCQKDYYESKKKIQKKNPTTNKKQRKHLISKPERPPKKRPGFRLELRLLEPPSTDQKPPKEQQNHKVTYNPHISQLVDNLGGCIPCVYKVTFADKLYMARSWSLFAYIYAFLRFEVHQSPVMSRKLVEKS